jgi:hypothetical protein
MARELSDRCERKPPPGRYAQGKRSPIVWVLLCDVCAGFALNVDESYQGYLSGRCQGCGCQAPELHRFHAYISTAEGCDAHSGACAGRHPRVFGDVRAYGGDEADRLRAENEALKRDPRGSLHEDKAEIRRLRAENERLREKISEADALLGPWGGTPAGTVGAIENLIGQLREAEAVVYGLCDAWDGDTPQVGDPGSVVFGAWVEAAGYHAKYRMNPSPVGSPPFNEEVAQ